MDLEKEIKTEMWMTLNEIQRIIWKQILPEWKKVEGGNGSEAVKEFACMARYFIGC